jgi:hypothetical protein
MELSKKPYFVLYLVIFLINITGCTAMIDKKMASWVGRNVNDLIASWGPPQQTMSDGQGGQVLIYSQAKTWTTPGQATTNTYGNANTYGNIYGNTYQGNTYGSATSTTTYTPPQTSGYNAQRMFWADKDGRIYRWSWKGL